MKVVFATLAAAATAATYRATPPGYLSGIIELDNDVWGQFDLDWTGQDFIDPFSVSNTSWGEPWVRIKIEHTSVDGSGYLYAGSTSDVTSWYTTTVSSSTTPTNYLWDYDVDGDEFYWCGPVSAAPTSFSIWGVCGSLCLSADFKLSYAFYYNTPSSSTTTGNWCRDMWIDAPLGHVRENGKESYGLFASEFYGGASDEYLSQGHFGISTFIDRASDSSEQNLDLYFEANTDIGIGSTKLLMCYSSWNPILYQGAAVSEDDLRYFPTTTNGSATGLCDLGCYPNDDCSFASLSTGDLLDESGTTIGDDVSSFYATTVIVEASANIDGDHQLAFAFGHFPSPAASVQFSLFAFFAAFLLA